MVSYKFPRRGNNRAIAYCDTLPYLRNAYPASIPKYIKKLRMGSKRAYPYVSPTPTQLKPVKRKDTLMGEYTPKEVASIVKNELDRSLGKIPIRIRFFIHNS